MVSWKYYFDNKYNHKIQYIEKKNFYRRLHILIIKF